MADSRNSSLFRNLCILHLQKLTLELKCPLCLNLLSNPLVFPCNHIFCNECIELSEQNKQKCPTCDLDCVHQEIRSAPYMESIVRLCQSLEETVNAKAYEPSLAGKFSKTPSSNNMRCNSRKEHPSEILQKRNYPTFQLHDSVNSSKDETDAKKLRQAECEEFERTLECAIIREDVNTLIKKEMQTEGCKVAKGNSKGDSVNCSNGATNSKKSGARGTDSKLVVQSEPAKATNAKAVKDPNPNNPKRPPSAFFVFMEDFKQEYKAKHPNNKAVSVVAKAGFERWESLSDNEKAPFIAKDDKRKADYEKIIQGYIQ